MSTAAMWCAPTPRYSRRCCPASASICPSRWPNKRLPPISSPAQCGAFFVPVDHTSCFIPCATHNKKPAGVTGGLASFSAKRGSAVQALVVATGTELAATVVVVGAEAAAGQRTAFVLGQVQRTLANSDFLQHLLDLGRDA